MSECTYCEEEQASKRHLCDEHNPRTEPTIDTDECVGEHQCGSYCVECMGEHVHGLDGEALEEYVDDQDEEEDAEE